MPDRQPQQLEAPPVSVVQTSSEDATPAAENAARYQVAVRSEQEAKIAAAAIQAVQEEARKLTSSRQLADESLQQKLIRRVQRTLQEQRPVQQELGGLESEPLPSTAEIASLVRSVTEKAVELTIDIPHITVLPSREVNYGFHDFDLQNLSKIRFEPVSQEMLLRHLESERSASIQWGPQQAREARPEDYLVRQLFARDEVDYDQYADLLYKLAGQLVEHLRSYLHDEAEVENVLLYWQKQLGDFIWAQMQEQRWTTPCDYRGKVIAGFEVLRPATFILPAGEKPRHFRAPIADRRAIRQMVFEGFQRCCFPYQKFDSVEGEWRLAQLLEDDDKVLKWMKPAPGQFRIEYQEGRNYEPDFVVETDRVHLIVEPKRADQIDHDEVQAKARAAVRWCGFANEHALSNGGKPWTYLLVPDDQIVLGMSVARLAAEFARCPES